MAPRKSGDDDEAGAFERLVGDRVRRLEHDGIEPARPRTPALPRRTRRESASGHEFPRTPPPPPPEPRDDIAGPWHRPGVQLGVLRRLRRGGYGIEDELDLHGMTRQAAWGALGAFIARARGERVRCVRVIHGKGLRSQAGAPVLKPVVRQWLRDHEAVLAYTEAPMNDGGSGAIYVLLRARG